MYLILNTLYSSVFILCCVTRVSYIFVAAVLTSELQGKGEAVLTSVKTKSIDSQLDFIEEAEHESKRSYEDFCA